MSDETATLIPGTVIVAMRDEGIYVVRSKTYITMSVIDFAS